MTVTVALVVVEGEVAALGLDVEELITLLLVLVEVDVVVGLVLVEVVVVELVEVVGAAELLLLADDVVVPLLPLLVLDKTIGGL